MKFNARESKLGIVLIIVGILFIINNFDIFDLLGTILRLSPLLLVWWGFHILRKRARSTSHEDDFQIFADTVTTTSMPFVKNSSAFGDIQVKVESDEFSGGHLSSVFGKISIDLRNVRRVGSYGQLDLHSVFGDITVAVPDGIEIEVRGSNVFGSLITPEGNKVSGSVYRSDGFEVSSNRLVLKVSMVFGNLELIR